MKNRIIHLLRWEGTIGRGPYLLLGIALFLIKFNLDRLVSVLVFNQPWTVFDYKTAGELLWRSLPSTITGVHLATLLAMAIPFLWFGVGLTLRRLRDAGLPGWLVVLFVVPVVKLILFAVLSVLPSKPVREEVASLAQRRRKGMLSRFVPEHPMGSAVMGILVSLILGLPAVWLGTNVLGDYGWSLFIGLPFSMGFFAVLVYGFHHRRTFHSCLQVAVCTVVLAGAALLLVAMEGLICLIMAAPPAVVMAAIGGSVAYAIKSSDWWTAESPKLYCAVILAMPGTLGLEHLQLPPAPLFEVKSVVEVNAPPEVVWRHVVSFSELPPPHDWLFRAGIAYPVRAEIRGRGVGAIRYCNFSTGPFVEPIEVWDEPNLLRFSVSANPAPMQEWTPYHEIHPPHLAGFLVSEHGQFRLIALPNGHTQLEGTTWYHHHLWPARYWQVWSDYIIHRIHLRVLEHVKKLAENDEGSP